MPRPVPERIRPPAQGPPLSSRAVLWVGGLALVCLTLGAALAFEAATGGPTVVRLDAPAPRAPGVRAASLPPEARPIPDTLLTGIERAASEPIEEELTRLVAAVQYGFGASSFEVEPSLRAYVSHAVGRMNVHPAAFRLLVAAPQPRLAERRAEALRRAFAVAGLDPDKLQASSEAGPPAASIARL